MTRYSPGRLRISPDSFHFESSTPSTNHLEVPYLRVDSARHRSRAGQGSWSPVKKQRCVRTADLLSALPVAVAAHRAVGYTCSNFHTTVPSRPPSLYDVLRSRICGCARLLPSTSLDISSKESCLRRLREVGQLEQPNPKWSTTIVLNVLMSLPNRLKHTAVVQSRRRFVDFGIRLEHHSV